PDGRYQSGQELVRDLEQCKNTNSLTATKPKAQAAAAGVGSSSGADAVSAPGTPTDVPPSASPIPTLPKIAASAAVAEQPKPAFTVDPLMAEDDASPAAKVRKSFSEMSELPPLKEIKVVAAPSETSEPEVTEQLPQVDFKKSAPEKPKVQVREAAQKAVSEIRKTPPKLYLYAIAVALLVIGLIIVGMTVSNYMQDRDSGNSSAASVPPATAAAPQKAPEPAPV